MQEVATERDRPQQRSAAASVSASLTAFALPTLAIVIAIFALSVAFRSATRMDSKPLIDDAYYSLAVTENIADGHGVTIDGDQLTNGFQPLFTFAAVPAFLVTDSKVGAIRILTIMEWALFLSTAALLGDIARRAFANGKAADRRNLFWIVFTLYVGATYLFLTHYNGLETGCMLFFYSLPWWLYIRGATETTGGRLALGVVLGLTVLTRVDAVFLVVVIAGVMLLSWRLGALHERVIKVGIVCGTAFIVSLPWWIYNLVAFGSLMPSSGTAEQDLSIAPTRFPDLMFATFKVGAPWLSASSKDHNLGVEAIRVLAVATIFVFLWIYRGWLREWASDLGRHPERQRFLEFGAAVGVTCVILAVWYLETSGASWFYSRYLAPLALLAVLGVGFIAWRIGKQIGLAPVAICGGAAVLMLGLGVAPQHAGEAYPWKDQVDLVRERVPEGDVVAAGQTGALGFFRDNVVNLDGKVNPDALDYQDHMWEYLRQQNIVWFADEDEYFHYLGDDPTANGWRVVDTNGTWTLFHYEGPEATR